MKRAGILFLVMLFAACTLSYDPAGNTCSLAFNPSKEEIEAVGQVCQDILQKHKADVTTVIIVPTVAIPTPTPGMSVATPVPAVTVIPNPTPATAKVICEGPQQAPDGGGGFLWKNGEHCHCVTVLLPGKYRADAVIVTTAQGKQERLRYIDVGLPDKWGERQIWRGSQPVSKYQGQVKAVTGASQCVWTFRNSERVD